MPRFEVMAVADAQLKSATGKRAQITQEYLGYIAQLKAGEAGSLQASNDETLTAIRRRLTAASKLAGKELTVRRTADALYFWLATGRSTQRRRGRPRINRT